METHRRGFCRMEAIALDGSKRRRGSTQSSGAELRQFDSPIDLKRPAVYGAAFYLLLPHGPRSSIFSSVHRYRRGAGPGVLYPERHVPPTFSLSVGDA